MKKHQLLVSLSLSLTTFTGYAYLTSSAAVAQDREAESATEMSPSKADVAPAGSAATDSTKAAPATGDSTPADSNSTSTATSTSATSESAGQPAPANKHVDLVPSTSIAPPLPIDTGATKSAPSQGAADPTASGPLLEKRLALREKILWAKKQGIGIAAYQAEMGRIDAAAMSGTPLDELEQRIDHLSSGIDEQFERSQILKTQHPSSASSGMSDSLPPPSQGDAASGLGGLSTDRIMKALKQRFGDQLPNIDSATRDRLLNSDQAKQLLKKFQNGGN